MEYTMLAATLRVCSLSWSLPLPSSVPLRALKMVAAVLAFAVLLGGGPASSAARAQGTGALVLAGGAVRSDNTEVWERIVALAGGTGAPIAVLATASANPRGSAEGAVQALNRAGAQAFFVPAALLLKDTDYRQVVKDPQWVSRVRAAKGVFFTGGDQNRTMVALRQPDGSATPLLDAIWTVYRGGGVLGGTSAGTAIMSSTMFGGIEPLAALIEGVGAAGVMVPGLGFLGKNLLVDQHFLVQGRWARLIPGMLAHGYRLGLGVDENTAAVITQGQHLEVIGYKGALLVDLAEAKARGTAGPLEVDNVRLSYLARGDQYDLVARAFVPSAKKKQERLDPDSSAHRPIRFYTDLLANTAVVDWMQALISSTQTEALGLAFGAPTDPQPRLGFEFKLRKGPNSAAWDTGTAGGEDITVLNLYLDVRPVEMASPLFAPLDQPVRRTHPHTMAPTPSAPPATN